MFFFSLFPKHANDDKHNMTRKETFLVVMNSGRIEKSLGFRKKGERVLKGGCFFLLERGRFCSKGDCGFVPKYKKRKKRWKKERERERKKPKTLMLINRWLAEGVVGR